MREQRGACGAPHGLDDECGRFMGLAPYHREHLDEKLHRTDRPEEVDGGHGGQHVAREA